MNPYTKLSNRVYPRTIRSSAALGKQSPDATNIRQELLGQRACVESTHHKAGSPFIPANTELRANQKEVGVRVCRQIHPAADIRSTPSSIELNQPCHLRSSQHCKDPHASVFWRNRASTPSVCVVVPARTGDGSDNFFQTTRRGACRLACHESLNKFYQILVAQADIRRDGSINRRRRLQRNFKPSTHTTRHGRSMAKSAGFARRVVPLPSPSLYFESSIDHLSVALQHRLACVTTRGTSRLIFSLAAAHACFGLLWPALACIEGGSDKIAKLDGAAAFLHLDGRLGGRTGRLGGHLPPACVFDL
jgi:hypothetical protein